MANVLKSIANAALLPGRGVLLFLAALLFLCGSRPAFAAKDFNIRNGSTYYFTVKGEDGNVGIGTSTPQGGFVVTNGNVGVGTFSPAKALTVFGQIRTQDASGTADIYASAGSLVIGTNGNGAIKFWDNTAERMRISNGGNVGIGTMMTGATGRLNIIGGNVGVGTVTPQSALAVTNGNVGIGTWTAAGGNLIVNGGGNVGINSVWPGTALDVQGTARMTAFTLSTGAASGYVLQTNSVGVGTWVDAATLAGGNSGWSASGTNVYATTGSNNVGIGTSTPQGGLIVTNGNVGIGTWSPQATLDVDGFIGAEGSASSLGNPPTVKANTGWKIGFYSNQYAMGVAAWTMTLKTGQWVSVFSGAGTVLNPAGNGTALTPDTNAAVSLGANGAGIFRGNVGISTLLAFNQLTVNGAVGIGTGNSSFVTTTAPSGGMIVQGNVGLGSLAPGTPLDVQGTARMTAFTLSTGAANGYVLQTNSVGVGTWVDAATLAGGNSGWTANGTDVYTTTGSNNVGIGTSTPQGGLVVTNGNVGIGTWAPRAALDVQGTLSVAYFGGNVGVGTWVVGSSKLVVKGGNQVFATGAGTASIRAYNGLTLNHNNTTTFSPNTDISDVPRALSIVNESSTANAMSVMSFRQNTGGGWNQLLDLKFVNPGNGSSKLVYTFTESGSYIDRMTVTSSGNLGLGTVSPVNTVAVVGAVGIGTNANDSYLTTTAPTGGMIVEGNVGLATTTPQAGFVSMNNVGIGTWTAGGGRLILQGGNAGIGSAWPGVPLDVQGTVRSTGLTLTTGAAAGYVLQTNSVGVGTWVDAATLAGGNSGWSASGTNVYTATGSNNVGIGTTTPQGGLVVTNGNVGIGTWTPAALLTLSGGSSSDQIRVGQDMANYYKIGRNTTTGFLDFNGTQTGFTGYTLNGGNVGIGTITPQGAFVVTNGNVGIGTWLPRGILDVQGTMNTSYFAGNVGIGTSLTPQVLSVGGNISSIDASGNGSYYFGTSSVSLRSSTANNVLGFYTNGVEKMRLQAGNLGIGTGQTGSLLTVAGKVAIGADYAQFAAPTNGLIVEGNVGIGTVNPGTPLDIQGTVRSTGLTLTTGAAAGYVMQTNSVGVGTWVDAATLATSGGGWTASGTNVYTTTGSNNVGIGTTTPQGGLVVTNGNVGIGTWVAAQALTVASGNVGIGTVVGDSQRSLTIYGNGSNRPYIQFYGSNTGQSLLIYGKGSGVSNPAALTTPYGLEFTFGQSADENGFRINENTATVFQILNNNVGIGTITPQAGLVSMNNVGIGTWTADGGRLIVQGGECGGWLGLAGIGTGCKRHHPLGWRDHPGR